MDIVRPPTQLCWVAKIYIATCGPLPDVCTHWTRALILRSVLITRPHSSHAPRSYRAQIDKSVKLVAQKLQLGQGQTHVHTARAPDVLD